MTEITLRKDTSLYKLMLGGGQPFIGTMASTHARVMTLTLCDDEHCKLRSSVPTHVLVTEHYKELDRRSVTAISYAWVEFDRKNRIIGHYSNGEDVDKELGDDWILPDFVRTLHNLCRQPLTEACWIDQLCIRQKNTNEVRDTLTRIPHIFRALKVVVLLPGSICECAIERTRRFQAMGDDPPERGLICPNDASIVPSMSRLWTRQEFLYAKNLCFVWTS